MKKRTGKSTWISLCLICFLSVMTLCGSVSAKDFPSLTDCQVIHEEKFGGIYIRITIDDFNELGFVYGDSVDIAFSNGYELQDLPYYNGYYCPTGDALLVAYPGYPYIDVMINNGDSIWDIAGITEDDTATITLNEPGEYADIQNARDIRYSNERNDYPDDKTFANFRAVHAGEIAGDILYRSASPCDNSHNRASYVDVLIEEAGIRCIIDLADSEEDIRNYTEADDFDSPYFLSLYDAGNVLLLDMNTNYLSDKTRTAIAGALTALPEKEGPYLVHCMEGKDRTGFVCILLEALCGADYEEIKDDYMETYANYYGITETSQPERYAVIRDNVLGELISMLFGGEDFDPETADLEDAARSYLRESGMDDAQIDRLRETMTRDGL